MDSRWQSCTGTCCVLRAILWHQEIQVTCPLAVSVIIHGRGGSRGEEKREHLEEVNAALNICQKTLEEKAVEQNKTKQKNPYLTTRKQWGIWEAILSSSFQEQVIHKHTSYHGKLSTLMNSWRKAGRCHRGAKCFLGSSCDPAPIGPVCSARNCDWERWSRPGSGFKPTQVWWQTVAPPPACPPAGGEPWSMPRIHRDVSSYMWYSTEIMILKPKILSSLKSKRIFVNIYFFLEVT